MGPTGGTATVADGKVRLTFPPGAVSEPTFFEARAIKDYPATGGIVEGTVFEFTPAIRFSRQVQLTIEYDPANRPPGVQESSLRLHMLTSADWEDVPTTSVDESAKKVTQTESVK